ncbi:MAG: YdcF family protein [Candidatus Saccharimonadaceae bacterium]
MRRLFLIPALIVALVIGLSIYLQPNDFMSCGKQPVANTECDKANAIVVVSGGDTLARTTAGINLYKQGWADYLVLSGAALDKSGPSNAATMKLQAEEAGIPDYAILVDEEAMNTQENAENTQSIFKERNFHDVILVTSGYHQRRASLEFNKRAGGTIIRNYPVVSDKDWGWYWWLTPRGWWLTGGEIAKIIAFHLGAM